MYPRESSVPWIAVVALLAATALATCAPGLVAQAPTDSGSEPLQFEGPPPPRAPEVINRDSLGNATVRAVRLTQPLRLDGELDEPFYEATPSFSGFIQSVPDEGAPATERTEAWIWFDDEDVYVSARVWDSAPESEWVANELRRDGPQVRANDHFGVIFDTFYDRRNGVLVLHQSPRCADRPRDRERARCEPATGTPVWDVRTGRFEGGWTVEMQFPFKSLRYRPGLQQVWGVQMRRNVARKNESSHLTLIPRSVARTGGSGALRISMGGTLVGLEAPRTSRVFEVKPYGISGLDTDLTADPQVRNHLDADAGLDLKIGITNNLTI